MLNSIEIKKIGLAGMPERFSDYPDFHATWKVCLVGKKTAKCINLKGFLSSPGHW